MFGCWLWQIRDGARRCADYNGKMTSDLRFSGIDRLYGQGSAARLGLASVCVVGVGGVGSWVAEALTRSGIGRITLIDADDICVSNCNRQLPALVGNFGRGKVAAMAERMRLINPAVQISEISEFLTASNQDRLLASGIDLVIDACDAFRTKVDLIQWCRRRKLALIVCGSAGGRTDASKIQIRDLSRTEHDAMLSLIRKKLRAECGFPRNPDRYFGVQAVYSLENVRYPQADGSVCGLRPSGATALKLDCGGGLGAAMHITATFAMVAVGRALDRLLTESTR